MSIHRKGNYHYYSDISKCMGAQVWSYEPSIGWFVTAIVIKDNEIILDQILTEPYTKKEFRDFIDKGGINEIL